MKSERALLPARFPKSPHHENETISIFHAARVRPYVRRDSFPAMWIAVIRVNRPVQRFSPRRGSKLIEGNLCPSPVHCVYFHSRWSVKIRWTTKGSDRDEFEYRAVPRGMDGIFHELKRASAAVVGLHSFFFFFLALARNEYFIRVIVSRGKR